MKGKNEMCLLAVEGGSRSGQRPPLTPSAMYDLLGRTKSSFLVTAPDVVIHGGSTHWSTGPNLFKSSSNEQDCMRSERAKASD